MKVGSSIILLLICAAAKAHEPVRGRISATVGPYLYQTHLKRNYPGFDSPERLGFGISVLGDVDKNGGIEAGMFYINKFFFRKADTLAVKEKVKRMYITLGYRHWFTSRFSFAGAFFSSYLMGDPVIVQTDFVPKEASPATSALDNVDYGGDFSLQWEVWRLKGEMQPTFIIDLRYSISNTSRDHEDSDHRAVYFAYKQEVRLR
tara:strand:+ start:16523 stop:17134 length:612 start_codon:yes stop_codon:yes gene_type:complete